VWPFHISVTPCGFPSSKRWRHCDIHRCSLHSHTQESNKDVSRAERRAGLRVCRNDSLSACSPPPNRLLGSLLSDTAATLLRLNP
jgi:hypothetical protein